jgi:hypothetical protein
VKVKMTAVAASAMDNKDGPFAECHELIAEMRRIYRSAPNSLTDFSGVAGQSRISESKGA